MVDAERLHREIAGRESEYAVERRRAHFTRRILEAAPNLHASYQPADISNSIGTALADLFPNALALVLLGRRRNVPLEDPFAVAFNTLDTVDSTAAERMAREVTVAGFSAFATDSALARDHVVACVPICRDESRFGAIYVAVRMGTVANCDELAHYLRLFAIQVALSIRCAWSWEAGQEDLEIISTDCGMSVAHPELTLTQAKKTFERWLISGRLNQHRGNIAAAARSLDVDRGQLSRLVKRYNIDKRQFRSSPES